MVSIFHNILTTVPSALTTDVECMQVPKTRHSLKRCLDDVMCASTL